MEKYQLFETEHHKVILNEAAQLNREDPLSY